MLKRFTPQELDFGFAPGLGAGYAPSPAVSAPLHGATKPHEFWVKTLTLAALVAAIALAGVGAAMAKQALATIATAPASETATWAIMLVGVGMIGFAARRQNIGGTPPFPLIGHSNARNGRPDPCWL
jgi:hypothetical protein